MPSEANDKIEIPQQRFRNIEQRQAEILEKLASVRELVEEIHERCKLGLINSSSDIELSSEEEFVDLVVNTNPKVPPFSLLFLHKLLRDHYGVGIMFRVYVHSSINGLNKDFLTIFKQLEERSLQDTQNGIRKILTITLIWKSTVNGLECVVNPFSQPKINGEANLARFISRLIPVIYPLNYDSLDWNTVSLVNGWIEQALDPKLFSLALVEGILNKNSASTSMLSNSMSNYGYSNGPYLLGQCISIADFILYSAVARHLLKNINSMNLGKFPKLRCWIEHCQIYGEFELFRLSYK